MLEKLTLKEARELSGKAFSIDNLIGIIEVEKPRWANYYPPGTVGNKHYVYLIYKEPFIDWLKERGWTDEAV